MMGYQHSWLRVSLVASLLLLTLVLLSLRGRAEYLPDHQPLHEFPAKLGVWQGTDVPLAPEISEALGPGEFLFRDYANPPRDDYVNLYIAFFPSQRSGNTVHSPKNCLPGSGWQPAEAGYLSIKTPSGMAMTMNRYVVEKGADRALVLYWYQAHGRVTPGEYSAKFYLIYDALRMNRSDGALIRIVTTVEPGESTAEAERRAVGFARQILPELDRFIPR
jgi:EpsI family protein